MQIFLAGILSPHVPLVFGSNLPWNALSLPLTRLENDAFDEDGNALSDMGFGGDQLAIRSPPSLNEDAYTLYYPQEKR